MLASIIVTFRVIDRDLRGAVEACRSVAHCVIRPPRRSRRGLAGVAVDRAGGAHEPSEQTYQVDLHVGRAPRIVVRRPAGLAPPTGVGFSRAVDSLGNIFGDRL
jgi:hypothetical protein